MRDVGNAGDFADTAVRQAIENGWFAGPTVVNSGKIIIQILKKVNFVMKDGKIVRKPD